MDFLFDIKNMTNSQNVSGRRNKKSDQSLAPKTYTHISLISKSDFLQLVSASTWSTSEILSSSSDDQPISSLTISTMTNERIVNSLYGRKIAHSLRMSLCQFRVFHNILIHHLSLRCGAPLWIVSLLLLLYRNVLNLPRWPVTTLKSFVP